MANVVYIKGVRTRFRNILEAEIKRGEDLLVTQNTDEVSVSEFSQEVITCQEKIKMYSGKLEIQSEKLACSLEDDGTVQMETIIDEDTMLCSKAMDLTWKLKRLYEHISELKKTEIKKEVQREESISQIVRLQGDMQRLLSEQMAAKEKNENKGEYQNSSIKLPKLELQKFNGNKLKWMEFWDCFESSVHANKRLTDAEKFNYLKNNLVGPDLSAISGLSLSNDNYCFTLDILRNRFGSPQEIIDVHYKALINLNSTINKVSSLRQFLDKVNRHIRGLEVLHQNIDQAVFVSIVKSKLPEDVLLQLEMKLGRTKQWTVTMLCDYLNDYVVAREKAVSGTKNQSETDSISQQTKRDQGNKVEEKSSALVNASSKQHHQGSRVNGKHCGFCGKGHMSDECDRFKTVSERKGCLKGCCYKCLKRGNSFKDCRTSKACVYCGDINVHHRSLCPKKFPFKMSTVNMVNEMEETTGTSAEENNLLAVNEMVLMQTAVTELSNADDSKKRSSRMLFDTGSHRSYITESLAKQLHLKVIGDHDLHLVTFGSNQAKRVTTKYAQVNVKLKKGHSMNITVNIVPVISGELQRKPIQDFSDARLQDIVGCLELADSLPTENDTSPIEVLIGNDYYWEFVNGEKIQVADGLYLVASKVGWILSGRTRETDFGEDLAMLSAGSVMSKCSTFIPVDKPVSTTADLENLWKIESIGVLDDQKDTDDTEAMNQFRETLKFEEGRYQVTWPWKSDENDLPSNKELAMGRLKSTLNRLGKKPELLQKYDDVLQDQLSKGVIEKVEGKKPDGKVHYIPHHAVITPQKVRPSYVSFMMHLPKQKRLTTV